MSWTRPVVQNVFSVDLEDWFCVANMESLFPREAWDAVPLRLDRPVELLLGLLDCVGVQATFFVLGWIAERLPGLIQRIRAAGHEIALHGYAHRRLTVMTRAEFEADLDRAIAAVSGVVPREALRGYRAPSFTIMKRTSWALDVLVSRGLRYDASIFPSSGHPDYGWPGFRADPHRLLNGLVELPMTPGTGGGYFRLFPYAWTRRLIRRLNARGRPPVFYIHPWELDPDQPRMKLPPLKRFRHYVNLKRTAPRLRRLLSDFRFGTAGGVLDEYGL